MFNWENALDGKDVNTQIKLFNQTILNNFGNFEPNKKKRSIIVIHLPQTTSHIKNKIQLNKNFYQQFLKNTKNSKKLDDHHNEINNLICESKEEYSHLTSTALNCSSLSTKIY